MTDQNLFNFFLFISYFLLTNVAQGSIITLKWANLAEFQAGGWKPMGYGMGDGVHFDLPSSLSQDLYSLDQSSSNGVWSGTSSGVGLWFRLDLDDIYCDASEATVSVKTYFETRNTSVTYFRECQNETSCTTHMDALNPSNGLTWSTTLLRINQSSRIILIYGHVGNNLPTRHFLLDEVSLSHNGQNCRDVCNETCEYRAIDCQNYYSCINFTHKEYFQCSPGLAFNPKLGVCDLAENVAGCEGMCRCEYRPHKEDCSKYYFCEDTCHAESCELRECPTGLKWSVDSEQDGSGHQQCTHAENAICFSK